MKHLTLLPQRLRTWLVLLLAAFMGTQSAMAQEAYVVRSTDYKTLTFYYDNLKSARVGATFSLNSGATVPAWLKDEEAFRSYYVNKVIFDYSFRDARPTSTYQWFYQLRQLTHIYNLDNLNTSQVTTMAEMFSTCNQLKILDLSSFDMTRVTNTSRMFYCCGDLRTIYVNTSTWNLSAVTTSDYMFAGCNYLVGGAGTAYTSSHEDKTYARIDYGSNSNSPGYLTTAPKDYAVYTPDNHTLTFYFDNNRASRPGTRYFLNKDIIGANEPLWVTDGTNASVTKVVFDSEFIHSNVTTTHQWFYQMTSLTEIQGLDNLRSSVIRDMSQMFEGCGLTDYDFTQTHFAVFNTEDMGRMFYDSKFTKIDLSNWNTTVPGTYTMSLGDVRVMFANCSNLETVVLTGPAWDMSTLSDAPGMFRDCPRITTIVTNGNWSLSGVNTSDMFKGCTSLVGYNGTAYDPSHVHGNYARFDGGPTSSSPGYFTYLPYAELSSDHKTLTFYCDNNRPSGAYLLNHGSNKPGWNTYASSVEKVVFHSSFAHARPATTYYWFAGMQNLTSIEGTEYLNTSQTNNMGYMFSSCKKLTTLDLSRFSTSKATDMLWMFGSCTNLTTIYVGDGWDVSNVTRHDPMFSGSTKLVGAKGTTYTSGTNTTNKTYARIDGGTSSPGYLSPAPYAVLSSSGQTLTFYCDTKRSTRAGTTFYFNNASDQGWKAYSSYITNVRFDASFATARPTDMSKWFSGCYKLTTIDGLENLNTSEVVNMQYLFSGCSKLTSLDLTPFDTHKVTAMSGMFQNCSSLTTIYVSSAGWYIGAVTSSSNMFLGCTALKGGAGTTYNSSIIDKTYARIDYGPSSSIPGYLTRTLQREMYAVYTESNTRLTFYYDERKAYRTGDVKVMDYGGYHRPQWYEDGTNASVTNVVFDMSFAQARPTTTAFWFSNMENLTTITGLTFLNTSQVTSMTRMFYYCSKLQSLDLSYFDTSNVTNMNWMFRSCGIPTSLDLSSFDTGKVTSMEYMFQYYKGTELDVSNFNTANVTSMNGMFGYCTNLTSLDLSSFNTATVTNMAAMFSGDTKLKTILAGTGWNTDAVTSYTDMFKGCTQLEGSAGTVFSSSHTDKEYARIDGGTSSPGYLSANGYAVLNSGTLTFYCDGLKSTRAGTIYNIPTAKEEAPGWYNSSITHVVFDPSFALARPKTGYAWFRGQTGLTDITGIQYLNTSEMTSMKYMFNRCSSLTSLDLSTFNTSKVTDMMLMFFYSYNLKTLNLSGWDTNNVTIMVSMFEDCRELTTIYCEGTWKSSTNSDYMFSGCSKLKGAIDFDADKTTAAYANPATGYFSYRPYAVYWENVQGLYFYNDGRPDNKTGTVYYLDALGDDYPLWYVNDDASVSHSVKSVNFDASFVTARPTSTKGWFSGMTNITSISNIERLNTEYVENMEAMFEDCTGLTTLNLGTFNTANVKNMNSMFKGCTGLTTVNVSAKWTTGNVTTSTDMFTDCSAIVGGNGTAFSSSHVDKEYARQDVAGTPGYFSGELPYLILSPDETTLTFYNDGLSAEKEGTKYNFTNSYGDTPAWRSEGKSPGVTKVVFDSSFATVRPQWVNSWFSGMTNLTTIEGMEYFNFSETRRFNNLFSNCSSLTEIDLSHFTPGTGCAMGQMFYGCTNLKTIVVASNWTLNIVSNGDNMFGGCSSLVGGKGTVCDGTNNIGRTYACIDSGTSAPGYLTDGSRVQYYAYDASTNTMTYYYDRFYAQREAELGVGSVVTENEQAWDSYYWVQDCQNVQTIVFDESFKDAGVYTLSDGRLDQYIFGQELTSVVGLGNINLNGVTSLKFMFYDCPNLTSIDLSGLDLSGITDMSYMFDGCTSLQNITLDENFTTENVTNMSYMLSNGCTPAVIDAITHHEGFTTANVTSMSGMFQNNYGISGLNLEMFNTANVTNMSNMFNGCSSLETITVGPDWTTEAVTSSTNMFAGCTQLVGGDGTAFSSSHVDAAYAHIDVATANPGYLTGVKYPPYVVLDDVSCVMTFYADGKQAEKVGTMYNLPNEIAQPEWTDEYLNIKKVVFDPSFITVRPTNLFYWFNGLTNLEEIEGLENLITSEVTNMQSLFQNCQSLTTLDLSTFDTQNVTDMSYMFWGCRNLQHIYVGSGWTTEDVNTGVGMFNECFVLEGSAGTVYDAATHGGEVEVRQFAHVDGGENNPGLLSGKPEGYAVYDSNAKTLTFYYDGMKLVRSNVYDLNEGTDAPGWVANSTASPLTNATRAVIDPSFAEARPTSTCGWFNLYYLQEIEGIEYLNTSEVTIMNAMFARSAIPNIDLSHFDTRKVTSMRYMFWGAHNLTTLDLSSFNTENVTDMRSMFAGYDSSHTNNLTTIYVGPGWSTEQVTTANSANMFINCPSLVGEAGTTYDAEHVDKAYAHIDGGTDNPGYLSIKPTPYAVYDDATLTLTFYNDSKSDEKEGTVYYLNEGSEQPEWYGRTLSEKVVFDSSFASARPTTTAYWFYSMSNLTSIEGIENLNTSDVTSMRYMFANCTTLPALDLSSFNTENVTDMCSMFAACWVLESLDIRNFNTSKVRDMHYMFFSCAALTTLDLSSFSTPELVATKQMFYACWELTTVYVGDGWSMAKVTDSAYREQMFIGAAKLRGGQGTEWVDNYEDASFEDYIYAHIDGGADNPGYFTAAPEPYVVFDGTSTLTFYCDNQRDMRTGTIYDLNEGSTDPAWSVGSGINGQVKTVVFDPSFANARPTTTFRWFLGYTALTKIEGIENLNTSEVTTMREMFNVCSSLPSVDLSHFDTRKVQSFQGMFQRCAAMTKIDVSSFDTQAATVISGMFYNCKHITSLDLSNFNTSKVNDMMMMFRGCTALTTIYVGDGWSTAGVVANGSYYMFKDCSALVGEAGTTYDADHVDKTYAHIDGGTDNPGYFTEKHEPYVCLDGETLKFYCDGKVEERIELLGHAWSLNEGTTTPDWYTWRDDIKGVVFDASFATARPTSTAWWFARMKNLTKIEGMENLNTSEVTTMRGMFCITSLTTLDLTSLNTANVTDMNRMFAGYSNVEPNYLSVIYVGEGWNTDNVTDSSYMFAFCPDLVGGAGTTYDAAHVDASYAHIDGGTDNPGYLSEKHEPYAVGIEEDGTLTFYCDGKADEKEGTVYSLPEGGIPPGYNASGFTKAVFDASFASARPTSTRNWFLACSSVTEIEGLEYLNTSEVTDMYCMFAGCASLASLDLSHFNTAKVTDMRDMFNICSSLKTIYVGDGWSTAALTMPELNMFNGCTSLVGGAGTTYDAAHVDASYAHIDGGTDNPGYFTEKPAFLRGDVNGDGSVTIADVTALVNIILGKSAAPASGVADVNEDGGVTIADVTALVNIILGKN